jgi:hypothetical protein
LESKLAILASSGEGFPPSPPGLYQLGFIFCVDISSSMLNLSLLYVESIIFYVDFRVAS